MKVFIKKKGSGMYLTRSEEWTGNAAEARDFQRFTLALDHVQKRKLENVEALYWFENEPRYNFVLSF